MKRQPINAAKAETGQTLVQRAIEALDRGDAPSAAALARDAVSTTPSDALGWEVLSIALHRTGDFDRRYRSRPASHRA